MNHCYASLPEFKAPLVVQLICAIHSVFSLSYLGASCLLPALKSVNCVSCDYFFVGKQKLL